MNTRVRLKPGQKGTRKLLKQYGDALVCVRYRYDSEKCKQFKTVEIIVSETPWTPPPAKYAASDLVALHIGFEENPCKSKQNHLAASGIDSARFG